jgi:DNA polymerase III subunit epsilon
MRVEAAAVRQPVRWWQRWRGRFRRGVEGGDPTHSQRWVVLDVESSGLDAHRDRLLAVAAVAVWVPAAGRPRVTLGDSFERVLRADMGADALPVDKPNILIHRIGIGAQRAGVAPTDALNDLRTWLGDAPVVGFHVAFDETLLQRTARQVQAGRWTNRFIDLAQVAQALHPEVRARSLDEWMALFGVTCAARHVAAADALATAEVLLHLWPALQREAGAGGIVTIDLLARLAAQRRWVAQAGR